MKIFSGIIRVALLGIFVIAALAAAPFILNNNSTKSHAVFLEGNDPKTCSRTTVCGVFRYGWTCKTITYCR